MAGRKAARGCHFFQEMRSRGSDEEPTAGAQDQLDLPKAACMAQKPKLRPDVRPLTAFGSPGRPQKTARLQAGLPRR